MTELEFQALLNRPEDETLDFKKEAYNLSDESKSHVKDVISMANTPREETSYIVFGVKRLPDGKNDLKGLTTYLDDADLHSQFKDLVYPQPTFKYEVISFQGKDFGIIAIPPERNGPIVPRRDIKGGNKLRARQFYFRRGSKNDEADPEDVKRIVDWFSGSGNFHARATAKISAPWDEFMQAVEGFGTTRRYILLASPSLAQPGVDLTSLAKLPWSAAFDFDPDSEDVGLLGELKPTLETKRGLHLAVFGNRSSSFNLDRSIYWFFARGLSGRENSLSLGADKEWRKTYRRELELQFDDLAKQLLPNPITCIALWNEPNLAGHLNEILGYVERSFHDSVNMVIVTQDDTDVNIHRIAENFDATLIEIPLYQLCSGLNAAFDTPEIPEDSYQLPSSSGALLPIESTQRLWLEEELEVLHYSRGSRPPAEATPGYDFLRGKEVNWYELGADYDAKREKYAKLNVQVNADLSRRSTVRINLYHDPGAGGTTVARRMLWDVHQRYPCAQLERFTPTETAERIYYLVSFTGQPVLLLVDGSKFIARQVDELYENLKSSHIPVVILQVLRRFDKQQEGDRNFFLDKGLVPGEMHRFYEKLVKEKPDRKQELQQLRDASGQISAFHFGLAAFGRDYLRLEKYVGERLDNLTPDQKFILGAIAISHRYAQRAFPIQIFTEHLDLNPNRALQLEKLFPPASAALELLIEVDEGLWRPAHDLIAVEVIEQLLTPPNGDRMQWYQNLSAWAGDFIDLCRGQGEVVSEELLEILRRVVIYRGNNELLGTESSGTKSYSQLLNDIKSREGQREVLKALVEFFPDEPHFWAHLGRFYSNRDKNYAEALNCIEKAMRLQPNPDHVLYHMKGMALRDQVYHLQDEQEDLAVQVPIAKAASEAFEKSRSIEAENEHAYISEAQMLIKLLDYSKRESRGFLIKSMSSSGADPYIGTALERIEDLLEQVRRNREGNNPNPYEEQCRAQLGALYGKHDEALQAWDNLLNRQGVYKPPIRRQIVRTYLARKDRRWSSLPQVEVDRIAKLLEENLEDEPQSESNLRLWIQALRYTAYPPSVGAIIQRLIYWKTSSNALDATYYLYILYVLEAIEGSLVSRQDAERYIEECRARTRFRGKNTKSFEWMGLKPGIAALIHLSELGEWVQDGERGFWKNTEVLERVKGRISKVQGPTIGEVEFSGLRAKFVPAVGGFSKRNENDRVTFYLGFSYEGPRAWEVTLV